MKRVWVCVCSVLLLAVLLCAPAAAAEVTAWGTIQENTAILCLPGAEKGKYVCQIGNTAAEIQSTAALSELETPVETVILIDNSLSIPKDQRPVILELLSDLIANRLPGERYTIATVSDQVNYLCKTESDYSALKALVDGLEFRDQHTQLTDGLYSVLEGLRQSDEGVLRRVLIIADGVDNKQVGYTQNELADLIRSVGYPLYTVGCSNSSATATEELQNLFALSRLASGESYYLPEFQKTMDIVSGVIAWNQSLQMKIELPSEVCDGMNKMLRLSSESGETVYLVELKMPFAEPAQPTEEPPPPAPAPEPEPEPEPESQHTVPWLIIGVGLLLVVAVVAVVVIVLRRKREQNRIEEEPDVAPPEIDGDQGKTVMLENGEQPDDDATSGIWDSGSKRRIVFQDLEKSSHRIEMPFHDEILVGRDPAVCQVVLAEITVSHRQCRIFERQGRVMIQNLSRSNITKLNGQKLYEECELIGGSTLQMGHLHMRVDIL